MDWVDWVEIERGSNWWFGKLWIHKKVNVKASSLRSKNMKLSIELNFSKWFGEMWIDERVYIEAWVAYS